MAQQHDGSPHTVTLTSLGHGDQAARPGGEHQRSILRRAATAREQAFAAHARAVRVLESIGAGPNWDDEGRPAARPFRRRRDEVAQLREVVDQLTSALQSRGVIEQAKGIIIGRSHCNPDEAFDVLRRASQRSNRKLRDVAAELVLRAQQGPANPGHPEAPPAAGRSVAGRAGRS